MMLDNVTVDNVRYSRSSEGVGGSSFSTLGSIGNKPTISDRTMAALDLFRSKPCERFIRSTVKAMPWLLGASGIWRCGFGCGDPEHLVRLMTTLLLHMLSQKNAVLFCFILLFDIIEFILVNVSRMFSSNKTDGSSWFLLAAISI